MKSIIIAAALSAAFAAPVAADPVADARSLFGETGWKIVTKALARGHLNCPGKPDKIHLTKDWKEVPGVPNTLHEECDKYRHWTDMNIYYAPRYGADIDIGLDRPDDGSDRWYWASFTKAHTLVAFGYDEVTVWPKPD